MSQPKRWVAATNKDAFVPGNLAKITETYPAVEVVYEGTIHRIHDQTVDLGDDNATVSAWLPGCGGSAVRVKAYVAPRPLPDTRGTIIEFYDVAMLTTRTATLGADGKWWINGMPDFQLPGTGFNGEFRIIYDPTGQ